MDHAYAAVDADERLRCRATRRICGNHVGPVLDLPGEVAVEGPEPGACRLVLVRGGGDALRLLLVLQVEAVPDLVDRGVAAYPAVRRRGYLAVEPEAVLWALAV